MMNGHTAQVCAFQRDVTSLSDDDEDDSDAVDCSRVCIHEMLECLSAKNEEVEKESADSDARINDLKRQF